MNDSFDQFYGQPNDPFYYELKPSKDLKAFLDSAQSQTSNAISETASFIKHYFDESELSAWFSQLETLHYNEDMVYDDTHGSPHYHGIAHLSDSRGDRPRSTPLDNCGQ